MGMVVDAASGANFDYPNEVKINMAPDLAAVPPHASPACRPPAPRNPSATTIRSGIFRLKRLANCSP